MKCHSTVLSNSKVTTQHKLGAFDGLCAGLLGIPILVECNGLTPKQVPQRTTQSWPVDIPDNTARSKAMLCDAMPIHFVEESEFAWICVHKPPNTAHTFFQSRVVSPFGCFGIYLDPWHALPIQDTTHPHTHTHTEYKKQNRLIYKKIYFAIILNDLRAPYNYKICFVRATLCPIHLVDTTWSPTLHCFWFRKAVEICANCIYLPLCSVFFNCSLQKEHTICTFFRQIKTL